MSEWGFILGQMNTGLSVSIHVGIWGTSKSLTPPGGSTTECWLCSCVAFSSFSVWFIYSASVDVYESVSCIEKCSPISNPQKLISKYLFYLANILVVALCQTVGLCSRLAVMFSCQNQFLLITDLRLKLFWTEQQHLYLGCVTTANKKMSTRVEALLEMQTLSATGSVLLFLFYPLTRLISQTW